MTTGPVSATLEGMDACSKCGRPAKFFRRKRSVILFACDHPEHIQMLGGGIDEWKSVNAAGGAILAAAKAGAAATKTVNVPSKPLK